MKWGGGVTLDTLETLDMKINPEGFLTVLEVTYSAAAASVAKYHLGLSPPS